MQACGVCHSDAFTIEGGVPGDRVPAGPRARDRRADRGRRRRRPRRGAAERPGLDPDDLSAEDAAPLLCAGITTFNALRESGARAGDLVAVLGIDGLGHLGVQFARRMGFETVAIARGTDKQEQARMQIPPFALIPGSTGVVGHASGTSKDWEDTPASGWS